MRQKGLKASTRISDFERANRPGLFTIYTEAPEQKAFRDLNSRFSSETVHMVEAAEDCISWLHCILNIHFADATEFTTYGE